METPGELRRVARAAARASVAPALWAENETFAEDLVRAIREHRAWHHPLIDALRDGSFDRDALRLMALEFHHAFGHLFPNVLLRAMQLAEQLEPEIGVSGACACRFLLQLNLLDELGFGDPQGPGAAHAAKQVELMAALGISDRERRDHRPSSAASRVQQVFEDASGEGDLLVPLLALTEMLSARFFGPARISFAARGVEATDYLDTHLEGDGDVPLDQLHADDLWCVVMQFTRPSRRNTIRSHLLQALGAVDAFLDSLVESAAGGARERSA